MLDRVGDTWSLLVLAVLADNPLRYSDLARATSPVSPGRYALARTTPPVFGSRCAEPVNPPPLPVIVGG
ncbi:winged helix-turn-helix transcriptional regulator [Nocardia farcinica]|uniref:winged helix-turn-helix transcriptional regulator n=1 Tax=Nocardia farcinica TaxID=37329 RepID=UPI002457A2D2|nr:hypothetical protein [Nocardia farcinica]